MRIALFGFFFSVGWLGAQSVPGVDAPQKADGRALSQKPAAPALALSEAPGAHWKLEPLTEAERTVRKRGLARHAGVTRSVTGASHDQLDWVVLADGRRDGRLAIEWPEARRLRVHFKDFDAQGGEVWLRDGEGNVAGGPYTGRGVYGDGDFWSEPVSGDRMVVEWVGPDGTEPRFTLDRMTHEWAIGAGGESAPCHLDVSCYAEWSNEARAVANLDFVGEDGGLYYCSGALVNTRRNSFAPLFLTANHCVNTEGEARSVVTYWGYQTAKCRGERPERARAQQVSGAQLLVTHDFPGGDFSLLRLSKLPDNAYLLGWNAQDPPVGSKTAGIHHPGGPPTNYKRLTLGVREWDHPGNISVDGTLVPELSFHQINEQEGRTEPGSSGSPLMNESKQVIGVLSYGPAAPPGFTYCDIRGESAYGKFSVIYAMARAYLEEIAPPTISVNKTLVSFRIVDGRVQEPKRQQLTVSTDSKNPVLFNISFGAPWVTTNEPSGRAGAGAPGVVELIAVPGAVAKSGKYRTTATVFIHPSQTWASAPKPVTLEVELDVAMNQAMVAATVEPNAVVEMPMTTAGYNFRFSLRLEEMAGIGVRITSLRMDGMDYSHLIGQILGTDKLDAHGVIQRSVEGRLEPNGQERLFEFGGWAPSTGERWSATARARFMPRQ